MKAISLHQPWASLLAHGLKRIETRGWPTAHRGPLLVHAAKKWDGALAELCLCEPFRSSLAGLGLPVPPTPHSWTTADMAAKKAGWGLPFGALVGRVTLAACFQVDRRVYSPPSPTEDAVGDFADGRFAWVCEDARAFAAAVPCVGRQGLFDAPDPDAQRPADPALGMRPCRASVCKVNGLRTPAERSQVLYVGRAFAGWPASEWGNPYKGAGAVDSFAEYARTKPADWWGRLWEACAHGWKPLGCWCYDGPAEGGMLVCHAAVLAHGLNQRFLTGGAA